MKVALCYFGNTGWKFAEDGTKVGLNPSNLHLNNLDKFKDATVDTFFHCWSNNIEKEIVETFKPKSFIFEDQIDFTSKAQQTQQEFTPNLREWFHNYRLKRSHTDFVSYDCGYRSRALSRWYSTQRVLYLLNDYIKESDTQYDYVLLLRFDVEFYSNFDFNRLSQNFIYAGNPSYWSARKSAEIQGKSFRDPFAWIRKFLRRDTLFTTQPTIKNSLSILAGVNFWHLSDTWFLASPMNIQVFGTLYDTFAKYLPSPHISSYCHLKANNLATKLRFYKTQWEDYDLLRQGKNGNSKVL